MSEKKKIIICISGASGAIYGVRTLEILRDVSYVETHLIMSPSGLQTLAAETDFSFDQVCELADVSHKFKDIGASIASGSLKAAGLMVAPCSIKTLSGIANSFADNLITRAADVCLKERRPVVLMVRETPLHLGHLELMIKAAQYGCSIVPPVPAFYYRPKSIDDIVTQTVGRALDQLDIDAGIVHRWKSED